MKTHKKCRGTGKALNHGCGEIVPVELYGKANRKYGLGLSCGCYGTWLRTTEEGKEQIKKTLISVKKKSEKEERRQLKEKKIDLYGKENRAKMNLACQKLSRLIDKAHGNHTCIDCHLPLDFHYKTDAGHFHTKGSNPSIAWNLHNIHAQYSSCNQNGLGGGKDLAYYEGLQKRYGNEYADYVRHDIVRLYPKLGLSNREVWEKLQIVKKLIRDFETFNFKDSLQARDLLNTMIGIYKNKR